MKYSRTWRHVLAGILSIGVVGIMGQGCPPPTPTTPSTEVAPTITGAGVSGTLVQGLPGSVQVQATVTDDDVVSAVTANLVRIGGSQAQPLVMGQNNLWTFTGTVTPPNSGQQRVTILASDESGLASQATATVNVASTQPTRQGPQITTVTVTGTLTINLPGTIGITATVVPVNGTITSVVADLSQVGGFTDTPLILTTGNIWSFAGLVTPGVAGSQIITIDATDSLGDTSTATANIVVRSASPTG